MLRNDLPPGRREVDLVAQELGNNAFGFQNRSLHNWSLIEAAGLELKQAAALVVTCWLSDWNGRAPASLGFWLKIASASRYGPHIGRSPSADYGSAWHALDDQVQDAMALLICHAREHPSWRPWVDEYARRIDYPPPRKASSKLAGQTA